MEWYGLGALALIGLAFYFVHRVERLLACGAAILGAFAAATYPAAHSERAVDWMLFVVGLAALMLGFSIVRVMLIRSVSLQLLARLDGGRGGSFREDVGERLREMRALHLVRAGADGNTLTPLGKLTADVVAACYRVLRMAP
jgi:hypothetical protein